MSTIQKLSAYPIILIIALAETPAGAQSFELPRAVDQSVTVTCLGEPAGKPELEKQELFKKETAAALAAMKIPKVAIELVFHEDSAPDDHPADTRRFPKLGGDVQPYLVRVKRETLAEDPVVLRRIAFHELAHIKNGDLDPQPFGGEEIDEDEKERRAEYTVWKTVGWDEYKLYWIHEFKKTPGQKSAIAEAFELEEVQRWLGVWIEPKR